MKSKDLAVMIVFAYLYASITFFFAPISFTSVQIRISCSLIPLIIIFGKPSMLGILVGHFIVNLSSPLGWLDFLSPLMFIPAKLIILKYGLVGVPIHVLSVGLWVGYVCSIVFGSPLLLNVGSVMIGEFIAEIVLGGLLFIGIKRLYKN